MSSQHPTQLQLERGVVEGVVECVVGREPAGDHSDVRGSTHRSMARVWMVTGPSFGGPPRAGQRIGRTVLGASPSGRLVSPRRLRSRWVAISVGCDLGGSYKPAAVARPPCTRAGGTQQPLTVVPARWPPCSPTTEGQPGS